MGKFSIRALLAATAVAAVAVPANAVESLSFIIDGNTFTQPFSITNNSTAGEKVTRFELNISAAGLIFDLNIGCPANNTSGTAFTPVGGTGVTTGLTSSTFSPGATNTNPPCPTDMALTFNSFDPSENFMWDVDVDQDGPNGAATINGNQMIGSTAFVDFDSGIRLTGIISAVAGNPDAGQFVVTGTAPIPTPEPAMIGLLGLGVLSLGLRRKKA